MRLEPPSAVRLSLLRAELRRRGLGGFIVPRADPHLGEYMPPHDARLAWLTGFDGSAGIAIVLVDQAPTDEAPTGEALVGEALGGAPAAIVFSDGRYTLQLASQTDGALWARGHMIETPPATWLARRLGAVATSIGYDPWLISEEALQRYLDAGIDMVAVAGNPIDAVWAAQPPPPLAPVVLQPLAQAGRSAAAKRAAIAADLVAAEQDAAVLSDPASINWLLNIRGGDVAFTPFALGFAVIDRSGEVALFMDAAKLSPDVRAALGNGVAVQPPEQLAPALLGFAGRRVRVDPAGSAAWFGQRLRAAGASVVPGPDPCLLPKACKTEAEQEGARAAHGRDGVALCRFLHAMAEAAMRHTEASAAALLDSLRARDARYAGESFPAISAAGGHGAIIHYRVTAASDRAIGADEVYLIDSGGQYPDGTTDVTRTIWTGPGAAPAGLRDHYTRVLAGHLDLAALIFPHGVAGPHLDAIARAALWRVGLDYDHGTGHGVGSYLSVHEGPAGIARTARMVPLAGGMILSNEPGFYLPGEYGIRIENLLLVCAADLGAAKPFLRFETLTLAPYARALIQPHGLSATQRAQVDAYHATVLATIGPALDDAARAWLRAECAPIAEASETAANAALQQQQAGIK